MVTMVTPSDFITTTETHPQVKKAEIDYECGRDVDIYVYPIGGGVAPAGLLTNILNYLIPKKLYCTHINVLPCGELLVSVKAEVRLNTNVLQSYVQSELITRFLSYFNDTNVQIKGRIYLSDLTEIIENIKGVNNSYIQEVLITPYATKVDGTITDLNWVISSFVNMQPTTVYYRILFINSTTFYIFVNGTFITQYNVGTMYTDTNVSFTVYGTYATNDTYEFNVYPNNFVDFVESDEYSAFYTTQPALNFSLVGGI
jgi:hypothetical protein